MRTKSRILRGGTLLAVVALIASCATFKGDIPINADLPETIYISPRNADGIQDEMVIDLSIPELELLVVQGYKFTVYTGDQVPVYSVEDEASRKARKIGVKIPAELTWNGTDSEGVPVPDGRYMYRAEAWDRKGNRGSTEFWYVVVDNVAPTVDLSTATEVFSPNGDGRLDVINIAQSNGSVEGLWTGTVLTSAGSVARTFRWEGQPADFEWDGHDGDGVLLPDDIYSYRIFSTDLAGNSAEFGLESIVMDTRATPVTLTTSLDAISPNDDGILDTAEFRPYLELTNNVTDWRIDVVDASNTVVRTFSDTGMPPAAVMFDGRGQGATALADGIYRGVLNVNYKNGDSPEGLSEPIRIDTVAPTASGSADYLLFSPDGDGELDMLPIRQSSSVEKLWEASVINSAGSKVADWFWLGEVRPITWTGLDRRGAKVPDGTYRYVLSSTDEAGNRGGFTVEAIRVDTRPTPVSLLVDAPAFSPKTGSSRPSMRFLPVLLVDQEVTEWTIKIADTAGRTVRTLSGKGQPATEVVFDGRSDSSPVVPDGMYTALLGVTYEKGNRTNARSPVFAVDTIAPQATVSTDYLVFSPDGDGRKDTILLLQSSSTEDLWNGALLNASGQVVATRTWRGRTAAYEWNGRTTAGQMAVDGVYSYRLSSTDMAGNSTSVTIGGIRVDTKPTPISIKALSSGLSPNGDGFMDAVRFELTAGVAAGIRGWTVDIIDADRHAVRSFSGVSPLPSTLIWDGHDSRDAVSRDGLYSGELSVEYEKGNLPIQSTTSFVLDTLAPSVTVRAAPRPFSPDGDGDADAVSITIRADDQSRIESWSAEILDPAGNRFVTFEGQGAPGAPIVWDGRSAGGELVQSADDYTVVAGAVDKFGNRGKGTLELPVDVLVQRIGDRLKIVISSIYFKPFTADYRDVDAEVASKNLQTLDRLAAVLKKYSGYSISLEGHAVRIYWNDPKRWQTEEAEVLVPLSTERAEVIKQALVDRGVVAGRMTPQGFGGTQPVVPHSDLEDRWKNRRVEFILQKK